MLAESLQMMKSETFRSHILPTLGKGTGGVTSSPSRMTSMVHQTHNGLRCVFSVSDSAVSHVLSGPPPSQTVEFMMVDMNSLFNRVQRFSFNIQNDRD